MDNSETPPSASETKYRPGPAGGSSVSSNASSAGSVGTHERSANLEFSSRDVERKLLQDENFMEETLNLDAADRLDLGVIFDKDLALNKPIGHETPEDPIAPYISKSFQKHDSSPPATIAIIARETRSLWFSAKRLRKSVETLPRVQNPEDPSQSPSLTQQKGPRQSVDYVERDDSASQIFERRIGSPDLIKPRPVSLQNFVYSPSSIILDARHEPVGDGDTAMGVDSLLNDTRFLSAFTGLPSDVPPEDLHQRLKDIILKYLERLDSEGVESNSNLSSSISNRIRLEVSSSWLNGLLSNIRTYNDLGSRLQSQRNAAQTIFNNQDTPKSTQISADPPSSPLHASEVNSLSWDGAPFESICEDVKDLVLQYRFQSKTETVQDWERKSFVSTSDDSDISESKKKSLDSDNALALLNYGSVRISLAVTRLVRAWQKFFTHLIDLIQPVSLGKQRVRWTCVSAAPAKKNIIPELSRRSAASR